MGRIATIEDTAMSGLPQYNNLKVIVRGRPRYLDPQLIGGTLRFAITSGFNFTALCPNNQVEIAEDVPIATSQILVSALPSWIEIETLVRLGESEAIGELHIVTDVIEVNGLPGITIDTPVIAAYSASTDQDVIPVLSLIGTPCGIFAPYPEAPTTTMNVESWYPLVPSDILLLSQTPDVLTSLQEYTISRANLVSTRPGVGEEPPTIYQYQVQLVTKTGLLPFVPDVGLTLYLKALPLFFRGTWGSGDIAIPSDVGPFVLDAFSGGPFDNHIVSTSLGIQTWDAFGNQANATLTGNQQWQEIPSNYLMLERPISSDSLLFWQRITGNFQFQKGGYFQAQLDDGSATIVTPVVFTADPIADLLSTAVPQGFVTGEKIQVSSTGTLPGGLTAAISYYVIVISSTQFQVADTQDHAINGIGIIDITSPGTGVHTYTDPNTGRFCFSTDLLVPKWPTDHDYGWVIPLYADSDATCVVQFEPQPQQIFEIPANTLTFIRPHVYVKYDTIAAGTIPSINSGDTTVTDPTANFASAGVLSGQSFSAGNTQISIVTTIASTLKISGSFPSALTNAPYQVYALILASMTANITSGNTVIIDPTTDFIAKGVIAGYVFSCAGIMIPIISVATNSITLASGFPLTLVAATYQIYRTVNSGVISSIAIGDMTVTDPSANFSGVSSNQFLAVGGTLWTITEVIKSTLKLASGFPTTVTAAPYQVLQLDTTQIDRMVISFKGSPNSSIEIRDWQYDGTVVNSLSYYILGTGDAYGQNRWLAGGFSIKPLFFNLAILYATYSDGVSRYNAGYLYD